MNKENKVRRRLTFLVSVFILLICFGFEHFISSDLINHINNPSMLVTVLFSLMSLIPMYWIPVQATRPSVLVIWALYLVVLIPSMIIPYLSIYIGIDHLVFFNVVLLLCFFLLCRSAGRPLSNYNYPPLSMYGFYAFFFVIYGILLLNVISVFGLDFSFVSLRDVYDVRTEYKDQLSSSQSSNYPIRWLLFIFNPFLIICGYIEKKNIWMLFLGLAGELFIYSISGLKSALFIGFVLILILYFLGKLRSIKSVPTLITFGVVCMIAIALIIDSIYFVDSILYKNIVTSLTLRRNIAMPGFLSGQYYNFFLHNPKMFMANNSLFGVLVDYHSFYGSRSAPEIVGAFVWGNAAPHANANIWADGYAQYGFIGMIVVSILLGFFLHIYDSISSGVDYRLSFVFLIAPAFAFSNSAFFTTIIGHGAGICILLLFLYMSAVRGHYSQKHKNTLTT
ncbi:O-antigen polymerase [Albibacterium indicum]|uniref:O-antigen polymerase n=1 Tax=Albibacterium indicum TaxID=2292082 RepID=UPI000E47DF6E|nr:O-antigen polymerase [Pedobacter indicus]